MWRRPMLATPRPTESGNEAAPPPRRSRDRATLITPDPRPSPARFCPTAASTSSPGHTGRTSPPARPQRTRAVELAGFGTNPDLHIDGVQVVVRPLGISEFVRAAS